MPWPVLFFVVGLVFSIGFWFGHRFGFQEGCHARGHEGERSLTDRELMHLECISVESLQRDIRVPAPVMTLSRPVRSRAKSA
jgi:hypothetical protein